MTKLRGRMCAGLVGTALVIGSPAARAEEISGTIVRTLMLSEDSRLVGDVTCQVAAAPCIAFGVPNIVLNLDGFTITGQGDATTGCQGASVPNEIGISSNGQNNVGIRGPGVVQRFQGDGILFLASAGGGIEAVTATTNCFSGIRVNPTSSGIRVEGNVSVRNGQTRAPCGGI